ncbi:unnamed protein product, partial [Ascophyllum nodosum]
MLVNKAVAATYASYGRTVSRHGGKLFLLGLVLAVIACVGLVNVRTTNDVLNIWMYTGTRLDGEKDFYEEFFGGFTRSQNVMISAADGSNAATPAGLNATLEGVQPFVPGGDDEITFDMDGQSFGVDDLCYSSPVPTVFKPYLSTQEEPLAWFMQGAYVSYGYRQVSLCAKNGTGPLPVPESDLEDGWGIDRFPCSRLTPLDCFREGGYDYPDAMKQLEEVSQFVAFNDAIQTAECVQDFGAEFEALLLKIGVSELQAASSTAEVTTQLSSIITGFSTWGYWRRQSYSSMTEEEIIAYLQEAREFAFSNSTAFECVILGGACCLSWGATKLETDLLFGGMDDVDGSIKHLLTTQVNFPVNHPLWISKMEDMGIASEEDRKKIVKGWESKEVDAMLPRFERDAGTGYAEGEPFEDIEFDFFAERSGDDLIEEGNDPEEYLIWSAYVGMLVFAALSMGAWKFSQLKSTALYSRVLLSLGGVFIVLLSTIACLGFISTIGIELTPLSVTAVPFLSLGIGIDDMFIFVYTLIRTTGFPGNPAGRLESTLVHAGPSVTITSVAVAGCFLVASAVAIPTVRYFSVHMGTQMLFHVILMHLMLLPMMYWDSVRVVNKRSDLFLVKLGAEGIVPEDEFAASHATAKFVEKIYAPLLGNKVFKAATIAVAVAATASLTWHGITEIELGVGLSKIAKEDSYEASFLETYEESFTADTCSLVTKDVDLGTYQETLLKIQGDVQQDVKWVSDVSSIRDNSWLADSLSSFLGLLAEPVDADSFDQSFAAWITGSGITKANDFYCTNGTDGPRVDCTEFDPDTTVIKASQQNFFLRDQARSLFPPSTRTLLNLSPIPPPPRSLGSTENKVRMFNDMREAVDGVDPNRDTYAYSKSFVLHSQYVRTWQIFGWVIGGGVVMVVVIISLLQGSLTVSLLMATSIVVVVLQVVFGLLPLLEVGMNGFTIVNLCVMVGLGVEFTAHIGRGFLFAPGEDRDERVKQTLMDLLWPTFAGACTTFLAVLPLAFSKI